MASEPADGAEEAAASAQEAAAAAGAAARAARKRRLEEKAEAESQQKTGACAGGGSAESEAARVERIAKKTAERRAAEAEEKARLERLAQRAEVRRQAKAEAAPAATEGPADELANTPAGKPGPTEEGPANAPATAAESGAAAAGAFASGGASGSTAKAGAKEEKRERKKKQEPSGAEVRAARKKRAERRAAGKRSSSTSSSRRRRKSEKKAAKQVEEDAPCFAWERIERGLAPITTSFGSFGVSVTHQEIEVFLRQCGAVEQQALVRFRALPAHLQAAIMELGPPGQCDNPTAILVARINDAEAGIIAASATQSLLDLLPQRKNDEIEKLIKDRQLDPNCAMRLRALTPAQQKFALTIPLHECKNPSAFILANLDNASMTSAGKIH